jgi:crossover junction endodeoxyribonuclease RuvC
MRVLGVDPGTVATGWGVVEEIGSQVRCLASGVIRVRGALPDRLGRIHGGLQEILGVYEPAALSLEKAFLSDNVQSAFRLGEARGAALVAAAQAGVAVFEYAPAEVKMAVVGYGRALKEQVQAMIARLLALPEPPATDAADALAAALCHLQTRRMQAVVTGGAPKGASVHLRAVTPRPRRLR